MKAGGKSALCWAGTLAVLGSVGCASFPIAPSGGGSGRIERPEASAEYDVLVAEFASMEQDFEAARAAYERAAAKDPDSAYIERRLAHVSAQLDDADGAYEHALRAVELDPNDEDSRLFLGRLSRMRRDIGAAERALRGDDGKPINESAALLLYQIYLDRSDLPRAREVARELVSSHPDVLGGHMALATVYERMGDPAAAERTLRKALDDHPGRFVLYGRLARLRRSAGNRQGEIEIYREILGTQPQHYGTLVSLGEAQIATGDAAAAITTYQRLVALYPGDIQSVRRLASLEYAEGQHQEALARLEATWAANPSQPELIYWIGQMRVGQGDNAGALAAFEQVPASHSLHPDARLQVASIHEAQNEIAKALAEVEPIYASQPSRALGFHLAGLRARAGDLPAARSLLESLLDDSPEDAEVLYQLGVVHGLADRPNLAVGYMERVLELDPENPQALNYIGYTWAERGERLEEAEELIQRALAQRPDDGYITDSLAWVYYMRARPLLDAGQRARGREMLLRARKTLFIAAELTGGDPVVSEHLGDVHLLLGEKARALEFYREALSGDWRADEQPQLLDKLQDLERELGTP